jgi:hypothetical protein
MGGLARRAGFIESMRTKAEKGVVRLFVAGPFELAAPDGGKVPAMRAPGAVARAHAAMRYDAMLLTPADLALVGDSAPKGLARWTTAPMQTKGEILARSGLRIAFVRFPMPTGPDGRPTEQQTREVVAEGFHLRGEADVVIGISPWGVSAEQAFLGHFSGSAQPFDVLLGGGPGPGHGGKMAAGGFTAWLRPYAQGKTVHVIRLENIPKRQRQAQAKREVDVRFDVVSLDDKISADRVVDTLLAPARASN